MLACRRTLGSWVVVALLGVTLAACGSAAAGSSQSEIAAQVAKCAMWQLKPSSSTAGLSTATFARAYPLQSFAIDLPSNSSAVVSGVVQYVMGYLQQDLRVGARVLIEVSGGTPATTQILSCFDGSYPYFIDHTNPGYYSQHSNDASAFLTGYLTAQFEATHIAAQGSPTSVLSALGTDVTSLTSRPGLSISTSTSIVWTNWLGSDSPTDCLNINGDSASPATAQTVLSRCVDSGELSPLPGNHVLLAGIGVGAQSIPQELMSNYMANAVCEVLTTRCEAR